MGKMHINLIVAIGEDGSIGKKGELIWKISEDLKRFKTLTSGHPVIMGRKTWESLPKKPLPNRHNIILSRQKDFVADGASVVHTMDDALRVAGDNDSYIIGGSEIYKAFLPLADTIYLTSIKKSCKEADAFLNIDYKDYWELTEESELKTTPDGIPYQYLTYTRVKGEDSDNK